MRYASERKKKWLRRINSDAFIGIITIDNTPEHKYRAQVWAIADAQDSRLDLLVPKGFFTGSRQVSNNGTVLPQTIKQVGGLQTTAGGSLSSSPPSEFF